MRKMHKEVDTLAKEILRQLAHKNNHCVIIVTHNPAVAEAADVVLKMKNGKLEIN